MRVWLSLLVGASIVAAGSAVALLRHTEGNEAPPVEPAPAPEADEGPLPRLPTTPTTLPPLPPAEDVPSVVPQNDSSNETPPPTNGSSWTFGGDEAAPPEGGDPPPVATEWTRQWRHDFTQATARIPIEALPGHDRFELTVSFFRQGQGVVTPGSGQVDLVHTSSPVARISCKTPFPFTSDAHCGPTSTIATEGDWEIAVSGAGEFEAIITLRATVSG